MVEVAIKKIKAGSAFRVTDETRDPEDDTLVDPDGGVTITVVDPEGTEVVAGAAMTKQSTGVYYYNGTSTTSWVKGMYHVTTRATDGSKVSIKEDRKLFEIY